MHRIRLGKLYLSHYVPGEPICWTADPELAYPFDSLQVAVWLARRITAEGVQGVTAH